MRIIYSCIFMFFSLSFLTAQTTLEEYNYITKGYKIQLESGLDMKRGYKFEELYRDSTTMTYLGKETVRKLIFTGLYKDDSSDPCAIMINYNRLDNGFQDIICIPHYDSDRKLWKMFYEKINTYGDDASKTLIFGLAKSSAYFSK